MSFETTEEAVAFVEANRLMFDGKTGFRHFAAQLADLKLFIEKLSRENEVLRKELETKESASNP